MTVKNHIIIIIFLSVLFVKAQDTVYNGGELNGTIFWQGTVRIQGDVVVARGAVLTIAPGTRVIFMAKKDQSKGGTDKTRCELIIRGGLVALGQVDNKIVFTSAENSPRMADWYGIQFLHNKVQSDIDYCIVEYAYNGITIKNTNNVSISNSEIRYNYYSGIRTEVKAEPKIVRCILSENGYAGIICELGSAPVLTENLISGNPMGLVILSLSQPNLGISGPGENKNLGKNQFSNNEEYDIYNHSTKNIFAQNNSWESQDSQEIIRKIYDRNNNVKFGSIQFEPVFNDRSRQSNLNRLMILSQESAAANSRPPARQNPQSVAVRPQPTQPVTENKISQQLDSSMQKILSSQTILTTQPLLAATNIAEPGNDDTEELPAEDISRIDYSQVFLEPFLDGGKKRVLYKESLNITETLKNVIEPGVIRLKVVVDQNGAAESVGILSGMNEIIDSAVLATVSKYKYEVGTINGNPVRFSTNEVFRFK